MVEVTEQANEAWDELFAPDRPQRLAFKAKNLIAEIDGNPSAAEERAEPFDDPGLQDLRGRRALRTVIDSGPPPLYLIWCRTSESDSVLLDFVHMG